MTWRSTKGEGQTAVRKVFIPVLYHHWERSARIWTGSDERGHDRLIAAIVAAGTTIDPRLGAVRDLANLLKHDNDQPAKSAHVAVRTRSTGWSDLLAASCGTYRGHILADRREPAR